MLPWIVLLLAAGLRLVRLGSQELRGDEAFSYLFARLPLPQILPTLLLEGDPHSPLHYYLLHGVMALLGDSEFALRLPSALLGLALVALLWRLGVETLGRRAGIWLAGLAAISQGLVWLSQDVRHQSVLAMLAAIAATLMLRRAIRSDRLTTWLGYAALCALCLYSFYYGVFALLAQGAHVLALRERWRILPRWGGAMLLAGLLFVPWLVAMWPSLTAAGQLSHPASPSLAGHWVTTTSWMMAGESLSPPLALGLTLGRWALAGLGAIAVWRRDRALVVLPVVWVLGALLGIWGVRYLRATFNAYYAIVAAPAFLLLLLAGGLDALWRHAWVGRGVALGIALALLAVNAGQLSRYYRDEGAGARSRGYRPTTVHIAARAQPGDLFLANAPDPCWGYYLRDVDIGYGMQPGAPGLPRETVEAELQQAIAPYQRVWFSPEHHYAWDRDGAVDHWLTYHALEAKRIDLGDRTLHAYVPAGLADLTMEPLGATWDGIAALQGYHLTIDGLPPGNSLPVPSAASHTTLAVTLLWEAVAPVPESYTVFVHLLGEDGRLLSQHDGVPVWGTRLTTTWQQGDRILDRHEVEVPALDAPESAVLVVGLYDSESVERALLPNGDDAMPMLELHIGE